jgi:hypothetical protein
MYRAFRIIPLLVCLAAGCGGGGKPTAPPDGIAVGGKVLLPNGATLTGGTLVLRPVAGLHGASSPIQANGTFAIADPAVVPGKYQVFVKIFDPNQKALRTAVPLRYQSSEDGDSDVVVDIRVATNDLVIKLNR